MPSSAWKGIAIACFVICAILLFVALERYQTNADNVKAFNAVRSNNRSPFGNLAGGMEVRPATPTATKYALVFATLAAIGGVVCLVKGLRGGAQADTPESGSEA